MGESATTAVGKWVCLSQEWKGKREKGKGKEERERCAEEREIILF